MIATATTIDELLKLIVQLRRDPSHRYLSAEKLTRSIEAARKAKTDGTSLFVAGGLTRAKL